MKGKGRDERFCPVCGMHLFNGKCLNCGWGSPDRKPCKKDYKYRRIV